MRSNGSVQVFGYIGGSTHDRVIYAKRTLRRRFFSFLLYIVESVKCSGISCAIFCLCGCLVKQWCILQVRTGQWILTLWTVYEFSNLYACATCTIISGGQCNFNGQIRLVGGSTQYEGRIEICMFTQWGTVCDNMWDATDATVVCRNRGFATTGS